MMMPYNPGVGDEVIIDAEVVKTHRMKRVGAIFNIVERRIDSHKYETIYFVRTGYGDIYQCRFGQFIAVKRRHIDEYI